MQLNLVGAHRECVRPGRFETNEPLLSRHRCVGFPARRVLQPSACHRALQSGGAFQQGHHFFAVLPPLQLVVAVAHHFVVSLVGHTVGTCIIAELFHSLLEQSLSAQFGLEAFFYECLKGFSAQRVGARREIDFHLATSAHAKARMRHRVPRLCAPGVERTEQDHAVAHATDQIRVGRQGEKQGVAPSDGEDIIGLFVDRHQTAQPIVVVPKIESEGDHLQ